MIRTQLTPDTNNITVIIPDSYIGKKVEITVSPEDDFKANGDEKDGIKKYKGMLSKDKAKEMQEFAVKIREEWDREI